MRVLICTGIFPNRSDLNRGVYIFQQAKALARYGQVRAIAPVPYFPAFLKLKGYTPYSNIPAIDTISDISISYPRYFLIPKIGRSLYGWFVFVSIFFTYRRIVKEFRPDLILGFHAYPYGFANVLLARLFKIPVFVGCRGSDINYFAKTLLRRNIIRWTLKKANKVLSVSQSLKNRIMELGVADEQVAVIGNGINDRLFYPQDKQAARRSVGLEGDHPVCVCVARLSHEKGVDVLIQAMAQVQHPQVKLVLVGSGADDASLKSLAGRLNLDDKIMFAGERPNQEVPAWLNAADLMILPSRNEGYPNVVAETLACGVPVVASSVGGVPEIITSDELGLLVEPDNPDRLAEAIDQALSMHWNPKNIANSLSRSWDQVARDILSEAADYVPPDVLSGIPGQS